MGQIIDKAGGLAGSAVDTVTSAPPVKAVSGGLFLVGAVLYGERMQLTRCIVAQ